MHNLTYYNPIEKVTTYLSIMISNYNIYYIMLQPLSPNTNKLGIAARLKLNRGMIFPNSTS